MVRRQIVLRTNAGVCKCLLVCLSFIAEEGEKEGNILTVATLRQVEAFPPGSKPSSVLTQFTQQAHISKAIRCRLWET